MNKKSFPLEIKSIEDSGAFSGYASIFNHHDRQNDVVLPGAFKKILASGQDLPILLNHDQSQVLGVYTKMVEDEKGLWVEGQLNLDVARSREVHSLMRQGALKNMSIGYLPIKAAAMTRDRQGRRNVSEIELVEVSILPVPANTLAQVFAVKQAATAEQVEEPIVESPELAELKAQVATLTTERDALTTQLTAAKETIGLHELVASLRRGPPTKAAA